jgi:predicted TPR repeat methyltransferase
MSPTQIGPEEAMKLAKKFARQGEYAQAISLYQQILTGAPRHKKARNALKALQKSQGLSSPQSRKQAEFSRLLSLYQSGQRDQAMAEARRLSRVHPEEPMPLNILGALLTDRGSYEGAVDCYNRALAIEPDYPDAINNLGAALVRLRRHDEAIDCYRRLLEQDPAEPDTHFNLGNALAHAGRLEEAIESYQRSAQLRPLYANTHLQLGRALKETGEYADALDALQNVLKLEPGKAEAYEQIADVYQDMARLDLALAWYRDAVKHGPSRAIAHYKLGSLLIRKGQPEEAGQALRTALELDPGNEEARHFLNVLEKRTASIAPQGYISSMFDSYAARFDKHLVDRLGYRGPEQLRQLVATSGLLTEPVAAAVDLGCGTGLCGMAFRDLAQHITGIDLSPKMIERARSRDVYDQLELGDLVTTLDKLGQRFDLFICADTFIYIGDIGPLLHSVSSHARPGALFAFTTESSAGDDVELRATGRYAHSRDYLEKLANQAGLTLVDYAEQPLRQEQREWLMGGYYLLRYGG